MRYAIVFALSLLAGGVVFLLTLRSGREDAVAYGFAEDVDDAGERVSETGEEAMTAGKGYAYLKVATAPLSMQDRLQGLVGVVLLVAVSAAGLAFAIYQLGHLINATIERFLEGG